MAIAAIWNVGSWGSTTHDVLANIIMGLLTNMRMHLRDIIDETSATNIYKQFERRQSNIGILWRSTCDGRRCVGELLIMFSRFHDFLAWCLGAVVVIDEEGITFVLLTNYRLKIETPNYYSKNINASIFIISVIWYDSIFTLFLNLIEYTR